MLTGAGGTIGFPEVSEIAKKKIAPLIEHSEKKWKQADWQGHLIDLIKFMQSYEGKKMIFNKDEVEKKVNSEKDFILIIDNDAKFITTAKSILEKEGYSVIVATNGKRGLKMLYDIKPSLIFMDIYLPDIDGFTILKNIVEKTRKMNVATILLSEDGREENRIRAYELGAMDFIAKPIKEDVFISFIRNRLALLEEIEHSAIIDDLTQLYNRKFMNNQLEQSIEAFERLNEPFSLALLDVDHFKKVNDTYGHIIGDEVLQDFAALMKEMKRNQDIVFRYGGEEFAILFPNTTKVKALFLIEQMRKRFAQKMFIGNGSTFHVTFSAGIVQSNPENLHREHLLDQADQALYFAKKSGRNQTKLFTSNELATRELTKINIIVVDDDFITRKRLIQHFEIWNPGKKFSKEVLEFNNGKSFLLGNWYNPNDKFMILLDGMMPDMDGFDVLEHIREKYSTKNVLVSMITGLIGKEYVVRALEGGAVDYILKPFDTNEVSARISRLISRMFV